MDLVEIQIQDYGGNWRTVSNVVNNLQRIGFELRSVQSRYPDRRVRARVGHGSGDRSVAPLSFWATPRGRSEEERTLTRVWGIQ